MLPRHIIACVLIFFPSLNLFNSSRSSCYFYYASGGFSLFDYNVLVLGIILGVSVKRGAGAGVGVGVRVSFFTYFFYVIFSFV